MVGILILMLFWLKYIFVGQKKHLISHPKKILVIRLWALGSSLLTFPMIKQLQHHYGKDVQYDLLATSRNIGVFKNQWYFGQIYNLFSLRGVWQMLLSFKKYDIVVDAEEYFRISSLVSLWVAKVSVGYANIGIRKLAYVHPSYYSEQQHNIVNCLSLLTPLWITIQPPECMEKLVYQEKDTIKVDRFLLDIRHSALDFRLICLHTWWAETSPDRFRASDNWIQLIQEIDRKYWDKVVILLTGTAFEQSWAQHILDMLPSTIRGHVISLCGKSTTFELAYLLTQCDLMISNDTWPMHLAAAMGTKTIGLFWPNIPQIFGPWPLQKNISLYKGTGKIYIQPHLWVFQTDITHTINNISPNDVLQYIDF